MSAASRLRNPSPIQNPIRSCLSSEKLLPASASFSLRISEIICPVTKWQAWGLFPARPDPRVCACETCLSYGKVSQNRDRLAVVLKIPRQWEARSSVERPFSPKTLLLHLTMMSIAPRCESPTSCWGFLFCRASHKSAVIHIVWKITT